MAEQGLEPGGPAFWINTASLEHVRLGVASHLDFIADPNRWGYPFRRGLFEIGRADFLLIAKAMGIDRDAAA